MIHSLSIWCCVEFLLCNKCCWNYKSAWRTSPCAVSRNSSLVVRWTNMQPSLNYSMCYLLLTEWEMCHIRVVFQGLYKLEGLKVVVVAELAHPLWWVSLIYSLMRAPPSGRASSGWGYRSVMCICVCCASDMTLLSCVVCFLWFRALCNLPIMNQHVGLFKVKWI